MSIDLSQFLPTFFEEALEHLAQLEAVLLAIDVSRPDPEDLSAIFRAAHSVKGGAATFGLGDIAELTHALENQLDKIRQGNLHLRSEMIDLFLRTGDQLRRMVEEHQQGILGDSTASQQLQQALHHLSDVDLRSPWRLHWPPKDEHGDLQERLLSENWQRQGDDWFYSGDLNAQALQSDLGFVLRAEEFSLFDPQGRRLEVDEGWGLFDTDSEPKGIPAEDPGWGFFVEPQPAPAALMPEKPTSSIKTAASTHEASTLRVAVEKIDQIMNLVGELVITQSMLQQMVLGLDSSEHERLHQGVAQLQRNTRELQEAAMSIRMIPISFVFSRFPRMVRDTAQKLGKLVQLVTLGEATELDRGVIEKLADPLTHLVRNSLDHGIESPERRRELGKPEQGTLTLKAFHQGGNILIRVSDDGAGLNREKILAKALERGLSVSEGMGDDEVWQLIFQPGFSTADVVSDVSGRGVGMDVVRRNITAMAGRIDIESQPGLGSTMTIRLPLTLAILDGMAVRVGAETYILPLSFVVESLQIGAADLRSVSAQGQLIHVRGDYLPVMTLDRLFGVERLPPTITAGVFVILESDQTRTALLVDELLGQHQVVIKSLEDNFRRVDGVSGATIMGDGRVALIIDVEALVRKSQD